MKQPMYRKSNYQPKYVMLPIGASKSLVINGFSIVSLVTLRKFYNLDKVGSASQDNLDCFLPQASI